MTQAAAAARSTTDVQLLATSFSSKFPTSSNPASDLVAQATDPRTGAVDTGRLAELVADAARTDPARAEAAYAAIEQELATSSAGDAGRFAADTRSAIHAGAAANGNDQSNVVPGPSITGAGQGAIQAGRNVAARGDLLTAAGTQRLVDNPILSIQWENTVSAWNNRSGFSQPLRDALQEAGITINPANLTPPAGSVGPTSGVSAGRANNINGAAAEQAIAARMQANGYQVTTAPGVANRVQDGTRVIDVVATRANADPRMSERVEIESKVGRTNFDGDAQRPGTPQYEVAKDAERLAANRAARVDGARMEIDGQTLSRGGRALDAVGKVARPVGLVMDAVEVGSAFRADGNQVGENTGRAVSGLAGAAAGGWGGAAAGAAIGTAIFPGVGTVVGGVVGGIAGALGGDAAGRGVFDTVKSWF